MDFSIPFMKLGLTVVMQKVPSQPIDLLAIFKPFSFWTWMLLLSSYLLTSLLLLVTSRLDQPPPSPLACLWLPIASLLGQSTDWLPSSASPRLLRPRRSRRPPPQTLPDLCLAKNLASLLFTLAEEISALQTMERQNKWLQIYCKQCSCKAMRYYLHKLQIYHY